MGAVNMGRVLGIDYGARRIGVAVSDPGQTIAFAHTVLSCDDPAAAVEALCKLCREQEVERVVVGWPLKMNGLPAASARQAEAFAHELQKRLTLPVELWDERLTTQSAERALLEHGMRRKKRRQVVDKIAAQIMLQHYLDSRSHG